MKIRLGFVSNSSSSSFVCSICGNSEGGYYGSYKDFGFVNCDNGHEFCESHLAFEMGELDFVIDKDLPDEEYNAKVKKFCVKYGFEVPSKRIVSGDRYNSLPKEFCPICNLKTLTYNDFISFLKKETGYTEAKAISEIKKKYGNYSTFKEAMRKK